MTPLATTDRDLPPEDTAPWPVAARASAIGAVVTALVLVGVLSLLTDAELAPEDRRFLFAGALGGTIAGSLGNGLVAHGALGLVGGPLASTRFLRGIVLDFGLQVFAVAGGTIGLFFLGVKFPGLAAFGLTLAGTAVMFRVPGTILVSRALSNRARRSQSAAADRLATDLTEPSRSNIGPSAQESHS